MKGMQGQFSFHPEPTGSDIRPQLQHGLDRRRAKAPECTEGQPVYGEMPGLRMSDLAIPPAPAAL